MSDKILLQLNKLEYNYLQIQEENKILKEKIINNGKIIDKLIIKSQELENFQNKLKLKDEIFKNKKNDLILLQNKLLKMIKNVINSKNDQFGSTIPIILFKLLDLVINFTKNTIENNLTVTPIESIFKLNDSINKLFDLCVSEGIINEKSEEKIERYKLINDSKSQILQELKKHQL